jgi:hypothetical protein
VFESENTEAQIGVDKIGTMGEMGKAYMILVRIPEKKETTCETYTWM